MPDSNPDFRPLALLIPGLDGTGRLYYRQAPELANKYRVLAWAYGPEDWCRLADLTNELGRATAGEPAGSILLVAESFGGLVALDYALRYPERIKRLVLINVFPYFRRRLAIWLAPRLVPLLELGIGRWCKMFIIDRTLRREGILPEDRRHYRKIVMQIARPAYRRRLQLIRETDLRPHLTRIPVPAILLASGRDKLVPSALEAHFMAGLMPHARVREFPQAGHALLLTPGFSLADHMEG